MTWREEAKEIGVALYDHDLKRVRKKEDVLAEIEVKNQSQTELFKIVISVKEANQICKDALFKYVTEQGFDNVICERYVESALKRGVFLNCKRKGLIFKGQKDDNTKLIETGTGGSQGSRESEHVSERSDR